MMVSMGVNFRKIAHIRSTDHVLDAVQENRPRHTEAALGSMSALSSLERTILAE
jgi:hypothetical protein